jgi:tryptophan-rich sensory protein
MKIKDKHILPLVICLAIPMLVGFLGSLATNPEITGWYANLIRPSFNPPNWLFGPVWTILFLLMGFALFGIWRQRPSKARTTALVMFAIQLLLNLAWSFIFFYFHALLWALLEILVLLNAIALTIRSFGKIDRRAAMLLLPYWAWVLFATFLTYSIWRLNY